MGSIGRLEEEVASKRTRGLLKTLLWCYSFARTPGGFLMRSTRFACGQCHTPLDESTWTAVKERKPCPTCGSRMRVAEEAIHELVEPRVPPQSIAQSPTGARTKR